MTDTGELGVYPQDVRDISVNPDAPDILLIADGGLRPVPGGAADRACEYVESTVYALQLDSGGDPWLCDTTTEIRLLPDSDPTSPDGYMHALVVSAGHALHDVDPDGTLSPDRCGLREVTWERGAEDDAVWRAVPYFGDDDDYAGGGSGCVLRPMYTSGIELSSGGHSVLVFGGSRGGMSQGPGGICEVQIGVAGALLTSSAPAAYVATQVLGADQLEFKVEDLLAHPHVADVYFAVVSEAMGCPTCDRIGLYAIQKRNRPGAASSWGSLLVSGDDLEHRQAGSLAYGTRDDGSGEVGDIFLGAASVVDGEITW